MHRIVINGQIGQEHAASFWAASTRETFNPPPLIGDLETDIAIIGGGFTGLSAAHHARFSGYSVAVLDANQIGWGGSGRNGGNVVPRYKQTFPELEKQYGLNVAIHMYRIAQDALDTLETIVNHHALKCDFWRTGLLTPLLKEIDITRFEKDVEWVKRHIGDTASRILNRRETAYMVGSDFYQAAYIEPRAAAIHPLEYCQGLGKALEKCNVRLFSGTPALSWRKKGDCLFIITPKGTVRARQLIIATNAYSHISVSGSRIKKTYIPVTSAVISTTSLQSDIRRSILPEGQVVTDAKRLTNYYRLMRDGSLIFGGRGSASDNEAEKVYENLRRSMVRIFPQLRDVSIQNKWCGSVAVTLDNLPFIGKLQESVHFAVGYSGRGVALSALLGRELARRAGGDIEDLGPISGRRFPRIPCYELRAPVRRIAMSYMSLMDKLGF